MSTDDYLENARPRWFDELTKAKQEGRTVFLLHFNIQDVVFDPKHPPTTPQDLKSVRDFLAGALSDRNTVLYYSLHTGIQLYAGTAPLLDRHFSQARADRLWPDVAADAADRPFKLMPPPGRTMDEAAPPDQWRTPNLAFRLLTRALLYDYAVDARPSATTQPAAAATAAQQTSSSKLSVGLIIDYLHHLAPALGVPTRHEVSEIVETLQRWSTAPAIREHNHVIILLAPDRASVHPELHGTDSRIKTVEIKRPDRKDRFDFLQWLSSFPDYAILTKTEVVDGQQQHMIDELANMSSGLNYVELRDFVVTMQRRKNDDWRKLLMALRTEIINRESGGLLVTKESNFHLRDVAGYHYVRQYVDPLLPRLREGRADFAGILLVGPPGTGKSFYAAALAADAGVNMVAMRNLRQMYVGQSERNLEQVLAVAGSLSPVIIFVDEIDQAFSNRRGMNVDSGVEQRLLGRLLEFMDDKENLGKVLWIAASNRPDLLDEALLSRFRLRLPFLLPDQEACMDLLRYKLPSQAGFQWQEESWEEIATELETMIKTRVIGHYSGRELETIVRQARWKAEDDEAALHDDKLRQEREAVGDKIASDHPTTEAPTPLENGGTITRLAVDAVYLKEAIDSANVGHDEQAYLYNSLLALRWVPSTSKTMIEAVRTALPASVVSDLLVLDKIDKDAIARKLAELRQQLQGSVWGDLRGQFS